MKNIKIKVKGKEVELCFSGCNCPGDAICALESLKESSGAFFDGANTKLKYSGLELNYSEEIEIAENIKRILGKDVSLIMKNTLSDKEIFYSLLENEKICKVIKSTIRGGEKVEARGSIIIYGDVNPGGEVIAKGDVCVVGILRGVVETEENARVFALSMQPSQIRIGKAISYNKKNENVGAAVAIAENGEIILECL